MSFSTGCRKCMKCGKMYLISLFDDGLCAECEKAEQEPKVTTTSTDEPMVMQYPQVDGITPTVVSPEEYTKYDMWIGEKQDSCDDAVSRILKRMWNCRGKHTTSIDKVKMEQIIRDELPSVRPQEQTGHWKFVCQHWRKCSECGFSHKFAEDWEYCPNCGAKMVEPQESEDEDKE